MDKKDSTKCLQSIATPNLIDIVEKDTGEEYLIDILITHESLTQSPLSNEKINKLKENESFRFVLDWSLSNSDIKWIIEQIGNKNVKINQIYNMFNSQDKEKDISDVDPKVFATAMSSVKMWKYPSNYKISEAQLSSLIEKISSGGTFQYNIEYLNLINIPCWNIDPIQLGRAAVKLEFVVMSQHITLHQMLTMLYTIHSNLLWNKLKEISFWRKSDLEFFPAHEMRQLRQSGIRIIPRTVL